MVLMVMDVVAVVVFAEYGDDLRMVAVVAAVVTVVVVIVTSAQPVSHHNSDASTHLCSFHENSHRKRIDERVEVRRCSGDGVAAVPTGGGAILEQTCFAVVAVVAVPAAIPLMHGAAEKMHSPRV